jgi:hypothetical protein
MSKITILASGQINTSDSITIELVRPRRPAGRRQNRLAGQPTVTGARKFPDTAAVIVKLFSEAATTLAAIKVGRKL